MPDWMAFNVDDYVSNTMHLTARQHGGYILLICAAWKCKGSLPGSDAALMAIAKSTPKEWATDGDVLKAFLTRRGEGWVHERVEFEWRDSEAIIAAKRRAGQEGAKRRWHGRSNGTPMAEPSPSHRQTDAPEPLPNHLPPFHGKTIGDAPRPPAPNGAASGSSELTPEAEWQRRVEGYNPSEIRKTWKPAWGPTPDSPATSKLIPAHLVQWWKAQRAEARQGSAA